MLKVLSYFKYIGIFVIFIIGIAIVTSLINLTGFKPNLINKLAVILTALSFFIVSSMASKNITEKGYILGIKLGLLFVILMILINLIFGNLDKENFINKLIDKIFYYFYKVMVIIY